MLSYLFGHRKEVVLHFDGYLTSPATDWVKLPIVLNGEKMDLKNIHVPHRYSALREVLENHQNCRRIIVFIHDTIELTDFAGRSSEHQLRAILDAVVQYPQAQVVLWDSLSEKEVGWIRPL